MAAVHMRLLRSAAGMTVFGLGTAVVMHRVHRPTYCDPAPPDGMSERQQIQVEELLEAHRAQVCSDVVNKVCGFVRKNFLLVIILVVAFFWLFVKDGKVTIFENAGASADATAPAVGCALKELPQMLNNDTFNPFN